MQMSQQYSTKNVNFTFRYKIPTKCRKMHYFWYRLCPCIFLLFINLSSNFWKSELHKEIKFLNPQFVFNIQAWFITKKIRGCLLNPNKLSFSTPSLPIPCPVFSTSHFVFGKQKNNFIRFYFIKLATVLKQFVFYFQSTHWTAWPQKKINFDLLIAAVNSHLTLIIKYNNNEFALNVWRNAVY